MAGTTKYLNELREKVEKQERRIEELEAKFAAIREDLEDEELDPFPMPAFPRTLLALGYEAPPSRTLQRPMDAARARRGSESTERGEKKG